MTPPPAQDLLLGVARRLVASRRPASALLLLAAAGQTRGPRQVKAAAGQILRNCLYTISHLPQARPCRPTCRRVTQPQQIKSRGEKSPAADSERARKAQSYDACVGQGGRQGLIRSLLYRV